MKRFNCYHFRLALVIILSCLCTSINAQIKYTSEGRLLIGDVQPQGHYHTLYGNIYMKEHYGNFFQIDVTPGAPRLAGHGDQVVFYNTQTSTFNRIQVKNVYNYSDARAKTDIKPLNNCLPRLMRLKVYSYKFKDDNKVATRALSKGGNANEYGMLAQEVEKVFPELVVTDDEGKKLINYTELIPMLINAVQDLSAEIKALKNKK